ncbi:hypothetical protein K431DRAFT_281063 [Polychaeton citri CBS 116435]|uniref:5-Methylcytosine G/T mismatch-specific DNA glycosylase n=1 Tax=Polychaeton citri CBS 116435 TaxID=1314669 RepID=A0A9P4UT43_9PEZI|nr:hypothetical protein K431DRAFT_281063 [Polychaeton citri CBS 116435]
MPSWTYPNAFDAALPFVGKSPHAPPTMPTTSARDDEPRRRKKEPSSSTSTSSKEKHRKHRPHKPEGSRPSTRDRERERDSDSVSDKSSVRRVKVAVPEMDRRPAGEELRSRTSYPGFSKAHSREAVRSREDTNKKDNFTPDATDLSQSSGKRRESAPPNPPPTHAPPSPPLTNDEPQVHRSGSGASMRKAADRAKDSMAGGRKSTDSDRTLNGVKNAKSGSSLRKEARYGESEISSMPGAFPDDGDGKSTPNSGYRRTASTGSQVPSTLSQTTVDSQATSVDPKRRAARPPKMKTFQEDEYIIATENSSPRTPTQDTRYPPDFKTGTPQIVDVGGSRNGTPWSGETPMEAPPPPPPPPPPPATGSGDIPRVDYLLRNGGLNYMIPKKLVQGPAPQQYSMYASPALAHPAPNEAYEKIFSSVFKRLEDYHQVLKSNGSMAVATGYRSVARRLLDKLSQVFARDISFQRCDCVMCRMNPQPNLSDEEENGVSWGEILEFVSGRRELPIWPPFTIEPDDNGLGISGTAQAPMQKLDIDVPLEYRDHYIKQNKKTKVAVQNWLAQQPEVPSGPPEEADEDTLMFAMMTKLPTAKRNSFIALMHGMASVSETRAPTPAQRPSTSSDALRRARVALQRLYRLDRPPRDCECAMYMLSNAELHSMLATLAEVNEQEWDILVSGRFDGFLWSGAEDRSAWPASASQYNGSSRAPSRNQPSRNQSTTPFSRNSTPFSGMSGYVASRGPTPLGQNQPSGFFPARGQTPGGGPIGGPAPVQMDEETEIAVLAEVERGIYTDMEKLEDAFELLHSRAEVVRQLLRERSAGLSMHAQIRRGSNAQEPWVRLGTPASGYTDFDDEDDDGLADMISLAPDDSASNISYNRRHRKRHERKTPAPVEEEDESLYEDPQEERRKGYSRRR